MVRLNEVEVHNTLLHMEHVPRTFADSPDSHNSSGARELRHTRTRCYGGARCLLMQPQYDTQVAQVCTGMGVRCKANEVCVSTRECPFAKERHRRGFCSRRWLVGLLESLFFNLKR